MNKTIIWTLVFILCLAPALASNTFNLSWNAFDQGDTYVNSGSATTNYGTGVFMRVGDNGASMYIYLKVNTSLTQLNKDINITNANLWLYRSALENNPTYNITNCSTGTFSETTITWNNRDTQVATCNPDGLINAYLGNESNETWYNFSVSSLVKNLSSNFIIKMIETTVSTRYNDYTTKEGVNTPKLEVTTEGYLLRVNVFDETTNTLLNVPVTLTTTASGYSKTQTINNGTRDFIGEPNANYSLSATATGYGQRTYYLTLTNNTEINISLINTTAANVGLKTFTVYNSAYQLLENVNVNISRYYGTQLIKIGSPVSNVQGQFNEYLDSSVNYNFVLSKTGYVTKSFNLYPSSSTYNVILVANQTFNFNDTQGDIQYSITPVSSVLPTMDAQNFTLTTASSSGYLNTFGSWANLSGDYQIINLSTSTGGSAKLTMNTTGHENSTLIVHYFMTTDGGSWNFNQSYLLYNGNYSGNQTVMGIFSGLTGDIDPLYRFLIAIILSLIVGAGFFVLIGATGAAIVAWLCFMAFGVFGFISWIFPTIVGILIVIGYVVTGGNDGT
jgi:hypothetical protein